MPRHQLAVCPPISPASLGRAGLAMLRRANTLQITATHLHQHFGANASILTDSGTSALVLAFRLMLGKAGVIALPGYGCVDIGAALRFAGMKARLYDIDPQTMSPDLDSVRQVLRRGVDAVLVAHYYGYPADVDGVRSLASAHGIPVLEDAAQAAGGRLAGRRLGSLGDLSVLSFGRGKGLYGGHGGALLAFTPEWRSRLVGVPRLAPRLGGVDVAAAAVQWLLGRPTWYGLPAAIPWLHLGETIYRPAAEPQSLSTAAASLIQTAIATEKRDLAIRVRHAAALRAMIEHTDSSLTAIRPIERAEPGYLRFALTDPSRTRCAAGRLGVMRGYPQTLAEQPALAPSLLPREPRTPGAEHLRSCLFTLPTHEKVTTDDLTYIRQWLSATGLPAQRSIIESSEPGEWIAPGAPAPHADTL